MKSKPETASQTAPQPGTQPGTQPESRRFQCRHIRVNGLRCGAVSLRGESLCFYHHSSRRRRHQPPTGDPQLEHIPVPLIEDRASIQIALNDIIARIATNAIDPRRAGLILYALQIASSNLPKEAPLKSKSAEEEDDGPIAVEDLELDPDLGPLAPIAEFITDDEAHKTLMQKFVEYCERPPNACKQCAQRAIIDANKAEGRRLMAELNRRRSLNLPEYDPPLNFHTPYPADEAWGAEERRLGLSAGVPPKPTPDISCHSSRSEESPHLPSISQHNTPAP
jgi:hypothetical protein